MQRVFEGKKANNFKRLDKRIRLGKKITSFSVQIETQLLELESSPFEFSGVSTSAHCHYKVAGLLISWYF